MNPLRKLLALAFNSASHRCLAIGLATNISIVGAEDWQPLADYGTTDYWREENGTWKKYQQVFTREQATKMQSAINVLKKKQGANFRGLPIYRGHPDADPRQWPDDARYGAVMDIEPREDAAYVQLAWNDLGAKNKEQGYYIYPSPAWLFDESEAKATGVIRPDVLQSVGLTNTPRIPSSKPWTNSEPAGFPEGSPAENNNPKNENTPNIMDLKKLAELLGLDPETATEEIVTAALKKHTEKPHSKPMEEAKVAATNALNEAARFRGLATNAALDKAINEGRITAAERPGFESKFAADFDAADKELAGRQIALNTQSLGLKPAEGDFDLSTPAGRQIAFNSELARLQKEGITDMNAAIAHLRTTSKGKAILAAMEKPQS